MKRIWLWLALLAAAAALGLFSAQGTDAADLQPAQVLLVSASGGTLRLTTDQGSTGFGKTLPPARFSSERWSMCSSRKAPAT